MMMMMMMMSGEPVRDTDDDVGVRENGGDGYSRYFYLAGLHSRGEDAGCGGRGQLGAAQVSTKL